MNERDLPRTPRKRPRRTVEKKLRELRADEVTFTLEIEPECEPYVGNCSAIDPETDREQEDWIRRELDAGNVAAWCSVVVRATWETPTGRTIVGIASLGACSYRSVMEIRRELYPEMCENALDDLNRSIGAIFDSADALRNALKEV